MVPGSDGCPTLPRDLLAIIIKHHLIRLGHLDVEELAILFLASLQDELLDCSNTLLNAQICMCSAHICFYPLRTIVSLGTLLVYR